MRRQYFHTYGSLLTPQSFLAPQFARRCCFLVAGSEEPKLEKIVIDADPKSQKIVKCILLHEDILFVGTGTGVGDSNLYRDGDIFAYDTESKRLLYHIVHAHNEGVTGLAISPKKGFLVSVSGQTGENKGGACKVWKLNKEDPKEEIKLVATILGGDPDAREELRKKYDRHKQKRGGLNRQRQTYSALRGGELFR